MGAIPRLVFNSYSFHVAINECINHAADVAERISDINLFYALQGRYSPHLGAHSTSVSSRVLFLNPKAVHFTSMRDRKRSWVAFKLNPVAALVLRNRLVTGVRDLLQERFEDFAFDWVCATKGRKAEVQSLRSTLSDGLQRIVALQNGEMVAFRPGAENFPMLDFALSITSWYNAKSVEPDKQSKYVYIGVEGAKLFLEELEELMNNCEAPLCCM